MTRLFFFGLSSISKLSVFSQGGFCKAALYCAWISEYNPFSERKSYAGSTTFAWRRHSVCAQLTGMPQFVLIPAPVTTTTFLDFPSVSAISCSARPDPGPTLMVGIVSVAQRKGALKPFFCPCQLARLDLKARQME